MSEAIEIDGKVVAQRWTGEHLDAEKWTLIDTETFGAGVDVYLSDTGTLMIDDGNAIITLDSQQVRALVALLTRKK